MNHRDKISRVQTSSGAENEWEPKSEIKLEDDLIESLNLLVERDNPMAGAAVKVLDSL